MSFKWKLTLDIADLYEGFDNDKLPLNELSNGVGNRLSALLDEIEKLTSKDNRIQFQEIVNDFKVIDEDAVNEDVEIALVDFDCMMADLYDLADIDHLLWIKTV